jgi:hypothetical protein
MSFFPDRQQNERRTYEPAAEQLERALRAIESCSDFYVMTPI